MFLRNYWYVAAYDHEIGRHPLGRIILGEPVVLYRLEDGTPVALEDRWAVDDAPGQQARADNGDRGCTTAPAHGGRPCRPRAPTGCSRAA